MRGGKEEAMQGPAAEEDVPRQNADRVIQAMEEKGLDENILKAGSNHAVKEIFEEGGKPISEFVYGKMEHADGKWVFRAAEMHLNLHNHPLNANSPLMTGLGRASEGKKAKAKANPAKYWNVEEDHRWVASKYEDPKHVEYLGPVLHGMPGILDPKDESERRRFYMGKRSEFEASMQDITKSTTAFTEDVFKLQVHGTDNSLMNAEEASRKFPDHVYQNVKDYTIPEGLDPKSRVIRTRPQGQKTPDSEEELERYGQSGR